MIIHVHFHLRPTGVTRSIENIIPSLNKYSVARVFGYGINAPKIGFFYLIRQVYSGDKPVIHTHRNNEMLFALLLRLFGGKFLLIFTRHSDTYPSKFTIWLMKKADYLVSLNPAMSESLPCKNTLIRHGVDTDIFNIGDKKKIAGFSQKNLISVIGRLRSEKGQLVVLEALASLLKENPDWGLVFIGRSDSEEYANRIGLTASSNGISSQLYLIPESNDIINYYQASTVVVIASLSEGFSMVCLEAMSCGLITVATGSVGIHSEVIAHGENGFLFQAGDTESLRSIMSDIMDGKSSLDPQKVRQTILDNWSADKSAQELLSLYGIQPRRVHP